MGQPTTYDSRSSATLRNLQTSPAETLLRCRRCDREFSTHEIRLFAHAFPADRYCVPCREADTADEDQKKAESILARAHLPAEYRDCSFATFQPLPGNEAALNAAMSWSKQMRHGPKPKRGLLLHGPPGGGKSHLSIALLKEVVFATSASALFLNVPEWLNDMKAAFQSGDGGFPPSPRGIRLLVLDDLGAERTTAWSADQLYSLINHRESNGLPTIASTNVSERDLEASLGRATMSRLLKLCMKVPLDIHRDLRNDPLPTVES